MKTAQIQLGNNVDIHTSTTINYVKFGDNIRVGKDSYLCGGENHLLEIGSGTVLAHHVLIDGAKAKITIGEYVGIPHQCVIVSDWQLAPGSKLEAAFPKQAAPIMIGNNSWLGACCVIAPGVSIGECCIIAANSYVDKDVPSYSVYGGNPARFLKKLDPKDLD